MTKLTLLIAILFMLTLMLVVPALAGQPTAYTPG